MHQSTQSGGKTFTGLGDGSKAVSKVKKSTRGHYRVEDSVMFTDVSERDLELKRDYAKDLVSKSIGISKDMLQLKAKGPAVQTIASVDEVYYVKQGKITVGKVMIRQQRTFKYNNLIIIFSKKYVRAPESKAKHPVKRSSKKATKGQKRHVASKRKSKDTRTF